MYCANQDFILSLLLFSPFCFSIFALVLLVLVLVEHDYMFEINNLILIV